jgi:hypothetical protein
MKCTIAQIKQLGIIDIGGALVGWRRTGISYRFFLVPLVETTLYVG